MTNVKPEQLNYDKYTDDQYDADIVNSIPFHKEIHQIIVDTVRSNFNSDKRYRILDLGVGTGITSEIIQNILPNSEFTVVDFSEQMLQGAKKKLGDKKVNYVLGDYSEIDVGKDFNIAVAVIGLHHQNNEGKRKMFKKIYELLVEDGVLIFGDLVTYKDKKEASFNDAKHFHHLVENTSDEESLKEWAYHHQHLNDLAPIEDQIEWLKEVGFDVDQKFLQMNTSLIICRKS
jgi:tRNA (cmo5U34)-methyltransferase